MFRPRPELRICSLYPDRLNVYGDRGNLMVLAQRCAWRGIGFTLVAADVGDSIDPDAHDLFYIGGGQDRDQHVAGLDLLDTKRETLRGAAARGAVVLGVCGGLPDAGSFLRGGGHSAYPGRGSLTPAPRGPPGPRLIGAVSVEMEVDGTARGAGRLREPRRAHPPRHQANDRSAASCADTATTGATARRACVAAT